MNHPVTLLCCCLILEDDSIEREGNSGKGTFAIPPFDLGAAQSFSRWQCVLRDAIDLNFIVCEPLTTLCVHKDVQWKTGSKSTGGVKSRYIFRYVYKCVPTIFSINLTKIEGVKSL